jgi:hypothetical protein
LGDLPATTVLIGVSVGPVYVPAMFNAEHNDLA